jgi:hypothetical protein
MSGCNAIGLACHRDKHHLYCIAQNVNNLPKNTAHRKIAKLNYDFQWLEGIDMQKPAHSELGATYGFCIAK